MSHIKFRSLKIGYLVCIVQLHVTKMAADAHVFISADIVTILQTAINLKQLTMYNHVHLTTFTSGGLNYFYGDKI